MTENVGDFGSLLLRFYEGAKPQGFGCWLWRAGKGTGRYANVMFLGKRHGQQQRERPHRVSYLIHHGPIPIDREIDHLCRNRRCVNPDHLEAVTHRVNVLRGVGFAALQFRQDKCKNGHPFSPENTCFSKSGHRSCITCRRAWWKEYRKKRRNKNGKM